MTEENVAVYLDFENLVLSADEAYPSREKPLSLGPIMDYITSKGNICVKKAYADWSRKTFSQYQNTLIEYGFEMIHLPATTGKLKNGADVRLAIDAMENMQLFHTTDIFVIGSGDTDFLSLIQRIRSRGKRVITLGFEHSVGGFLKTSSSEFKSIDELLGKPESGSLSSDMIESLNQDSGRALLVRYAVNRDSEGPVFMSKLKTDLLRLDPSFSEKKLGFSSFKKYLESFLGDVLESIELSPENSAPIVIFKERGTFMETSGNVEDPKTQAEKFLKKNLKYQKSHLRRLMSEKLFELLQTDSPMSMKDMIDRTYMDLKAKKVSKIAIRKFINTLFMSGVFQGAEDSTLPLLSRPLYLDSVIQDSKSLGQRYEQRIFVIIKNRFPALDDRTLKEMLS